MTEPTTPPEPPAPPAGPDWRTIVVGTLTALIVLLVLVLLLVRSGGDDGGDVATDDDTTTTAVTLPTTSSTTASTTTTTSTSTTTAPSTTVAAPTSTTTAPPTTSTSGPPPTIAVGRCNGRTGPSRPEPVAEVFHDAWTIDDRSCAEQVATDAAIEDLFVYDGSEADWTFEGCDDASTQQQRSDCFFRYEGGSATFDLRYDVVDGWSVTAVTFRAD